MCEGRTYAPRDAEGRVRHIGATWKAGEGLPGPWEVLDEVTRNAAERLELGDLGDQFADSGFLVPTEGSPGIPPELATLAFVEVDSDGQVTSDLYTTASVIGSRFVTALAIDPDADNLAPIDLTENGDGSLSWSTNLSALLDAVVASGAEPDPAIGMLFDTESSIAAEITGVGGSVTVQAPPDRLVVRPTGNDAADQRAFEQCDRA